MQRTQQTQCTGVQLVALVGAPCATLAVVRYQSSARSRQQQGMLEVLHVTAFVWQWCAGAHSSSGMAAGAAGRFRLLDPWCAYVEAHHKSHVVLEDTWRQVRDKQQPAAMQTAVNVAVLILTGFCWGQCSVYQELNTVVKQCSPLLLGPATWLHVSNPPAAVRWGHRERMGTISPPLMSNSLARWAYAWGGVSPSGCSVLLY